MKDKDEATWQRRAALAIWEDLSDRGDWPWDDLGDDLKEKIIARMEKLIQREAQRAGREGSGER